VLPSDRIHAFHKEIIGIELIVGSNDKCVAMLCQPLSHLSAGFLEPHHLLLRGRIQVSLRSDNQDLHR
jgi:hypothetical protein